MEMHRHGSVDGYGAGAPSDQSVDDMELVADLEHGTPPPGTDNTHAWQSETCTGTSDDGSSSAANERDSSDGNMPTVRRPFQNVLGLPYGYGKAQRPSHSSHRSQVDRGVKPWPRSGSIQPLQAHGTYPFDGSRDTHEGTPFSFLEESDTAHKRKISKVSSAHQYESYQTGNHTEGNAEASHRSRNEEPDTQFRAYQANIFDLNRQNFLLKQQFGAANNEAMQVGQELSIAQQQLHRLRLLVAKLASGNGSHALLPHEQRIIPECVQYARDLESINAMSGAANDAAANVNGGDAGICGNGAGGGMPRKHMARGIDMAMEMEREEMERGVDIGMETMESAPLDRVDSDIREQLSATCHQDQLLHTFDGASVTAVHTHAVVDSISAEGASLRRGRTSLKPWPGELPDGELQSPTCEHSDLTMRGGGGVSYADGDAFLGVRAGTAGSDVDAGISRTEPQNVVHESGMDLLSMPRQEFGTSLIDTKELSFSRGGGASAPDASHPGLVAPESVIVNASEQNDEATVGSEDMVRAKEEPQEQMDNESSAQEQVKNGGAKSESKGDGRQPRFWTAVEHKKFLEAVRLYGYGNARQIAAYVQTRNITQVRTHAQKYILKLSRMGSGSSASSKMPDPNMQMSGGPGMHMNMPNMPNMSHGGLSSMQGGLGSLPQHKRLLESQKMYEQSRLSQEEEDQSLSFLGERIEAGADARFHGGGGGRIEPPTGPRRHQHDSAYLPASLLNPYAAMQQMGQGQVPKAMIHAGMVAHGMHGRSQAMSRYTGDGTVTGGGGAGVSSGVSSSGSLPSNSNANAWMQNLDMYGTQSS